MREGFAAEPGRPGQRGGPGGGHRLVEPLPVGLAGAAPMAGPVLLRLAVEPVGELGGEEVAEDRLHLRERHEADLGSGGGVEHGAQGGPDPGEERWRVEEEGKMKALRVMREELCSAQGAAGVAVASREAIEVDDPYPFSDAVLLHIVCS